MNTPFLNLEALIRDAGLTVPTTLTAGPITTLTAGPVAVKKRKFMLVGTHAHQTTGYSKVTYNIVQELAKCPDIELYHFGFQKFMTAPHGYRPYPPGVNVHDTVAEENKGIVPKEAGFGFSQLPDYILKVKPDIIMIYNDAGVICQFLDKIEEKLKPADRTFKTIIYLDQVYILQRQILLARIDKAADAYFAFTDYWKTVLESQGIKKPIYVLRHGFDPHQFKPLDKITVRRKHGLPENAFVFLNLNRNTPRKRHDIVVTAFAELVAKHPTKPLALMCVCDPGDNGGFPIQEIFVQELTNRKVPVPFHAHKLLIAKSSLTYTDDLINELYALSDVGITAADGEGFGLCHFEAMGIGIPQIVPYIGGFRDFCKHGENCLTVTPKYKSYLPMSLSNIGGVTEVVDAHELSLAAEEYLLDTELREKHGEAARTTVLAYKWSDEVSKLADVIRTMV